MSVTADFLIVGSGFYGSTVAERLASNGRKVLVIEKRDHIGGNAYTYVDDDTQIEVHAYGSHIFHTSNDRVWKYLNQFTSFNNYRHTVWSIFKNRTYSLPINLNTINSFYGINLRPEEVGGFIKKEVIKERILNPKNLEEKAISMIGRPLYETFIKGYTIKQWEKDPTELSPDIITRLPVRYNYNNRYFRDRYEGIPVNGYTSIFERMLDHPNIEVHLNSDYFKLKPTIGEIPTIYSGPIDRFFDYKYGYLDWRTIDFERTVHDSADFQGCAVMNYAEEAVRYTRIHEYKHYHPEASHKDLTITFKEYSRIAGAVDEPYYPVNTPKNHELLKDYMKDANLCDNIYFGGRLGAYRYLDMDATVNSALLLSDRILEL